MADWGLLEHDLFHLLIIQKCFKHGCRRGELEWGNVLQCVYQNTMYTMSTKLSFKYLLFY